MGIVSGLKNMAVNALGYKTLKTQTNALKTTVVTLLSPQKASRKETFEEALVRLNLTEEDIQKRTQEFKRLLTIFGLLGILIAIYLIYALIEKAWIASLGTLGIL